MTATALILAAGEGTRMKSSLPKVAHRVLGVPLVTHVVTAARSAGIDRIVVVTGHGSDVVEGLLADAGVTFARQTEQLGTGHAVGCALEATGPLEGPVVVLAGDVPLVRPETIARLVENQASTGAACVLLTAVFSDPTGYGRIVRDESGAVTAIVEQKDLPEGLRSLHEGNVGTYCFDGGALQAHLGRLETANAQGEYYLTDLVGLFVTEGLRVEAVVADDVDESFGVNSRAQLAEVGRVMQRRVNEMHIASGVVVRSPELAWIAPGVVIGRGSIVEPMSFLLGSTEIGEDCVIGPDARITDSAIGAGCTVRGAVIRGARLQPGVSVGPGAYIGPGTVVSEGEL